MRIMFSSLIAPLAILGACSNSDANRAESPPAGNNSAATTTAPAGSNASMGASPAIALGLTADQLGDAEILDASGIEIAEVERVITDASGAVTGLLVEIEDSNPDRYVIIQLAGLTVVQDGDDQDLRSNLTREQLLALPATNR